MKKRDFLVNIACGGLMMGLLPAAFADEYPSKAIKVIVPVTAGSGTDVAARFVTNALARAWGATIIVENKPGAGALLGTDMVAKAPPDGYTLLFTYSAHYSNPWILATPFDAVKDFEPVARLANSALVVATSPESKLRNIRDLIAAAKQKPGALSYASAGSGSSGHMAGALLATMAGIELNHIPYKGASQVPVDAAAGVVDFMIGGLASALPLIKAGRLRVLAVTTEKRSPNLPDVPTVAESGLTGYENSSPIWVMAPRGTPQAIVNKLSDALTRIASTPEFKEYCLGLGIDVDVRPAAMEKAAAPGELEKWHRVVQLTAPSTGK